MTLGPIMKIALVSVLVLLALTTAGCVVRHPSDSEFRRLFEERRDSFLRLAATLETDGITGRLAAAELRSRKDIPEEKKEILSRLFAVFGNRELVCIKRDDGSTLFL